MTVTSTNQKVSFSGNGSTTVFAYNFKIFAQTDLLVILRSATGTETTQQLTSKYTVSGVGATSGGNVTMGTAPASGTTLVIQRVQPQLQGLDLVPNDPFPAQSMEDALDKLVFNVQTLNEEVSRSIKASTTNTIGNTEFTVSATDRANKLFSFDSSGNLAVTAGKVDTVTASASAVSPGGSPTAAATYTASSGALALAFGVVTGATGATGNSAGLQMTFSNSTSDADPGAGKLALNNGTVSSVNQLFFDDADDNGTSIASFVQSFDDVSNATGRGIIQIEKEGTASTFALFKVTGAVVDAAGYSKVPVSHLVSNGSFSNADGIRVDFSYSGNDGAGSLTEVVQDTSPELGGNLDVLARDIVSSSNRPIDLAPGGTGTVVIRGNDNPGTIVLNCESNTHGQTIKAQPHSASVTNTLTLPAGGNQTLIGTAGAVFTGDVTIPEGDLIIGSTAVTSTGAELNKLAGAGTLKQAGKESIWIPAAAMYPSTTNPCSDLTQVETTALRPDLKVLDFAAAADDFAQFSIAFPKSYNLSTISYQPYWTVTGTNTGTVVWQLGGVAITNDETINTAFGTLVATTALAHSGTSNDLMVSAESGAVTIAGSPADNDQCFFQINLDTSASGQTGAVRLLGVKLFFTTDAANDA